MAAMSNPFVFGVFVAAVGLAATLVAASGLALVEAGLSRSRFRALREFPRLAALTLSLALLLYFLPSALYQVGRLVFVRPEAPQETAWLAILLTVAWLLRHCAATLWRPIEEEYRAGLFAQDARRPAILLNTAAVLLLGLLGAELLFQPLCRWLREPALLHSLATSPELAGRVLLQALMGVGVCLISFRLIRRHATGDGVHRIRSWSLLLPQLFLLHVLAYSVPAILYEAGLHVFHCEFDILNSQFQIPGRSLLTGIQGIVGGLVCFALAVKAHTGLEAAVHPERNLGAARTHDTARKRRAMKRAAKKIARLEIDACHKVFRDQEALDQHLADLDDVERVEIGHSREGQAIHGLRFGQGNRAVSIVAGAHADEPIGPMTAQALPILLREHFPGLLKRFRFHIVPQINPDGADANRPWFGEPLRFEDYAQGVIREAPGDDIEFGFGEDDEARPECRAAMDFLGEGGPYAAHFSLHGMPFAEGAWFLLCYEWADRSWPLTDALKKICRNLKVPLHDIDRKGEKGFSRMRPGFSTTPTSTAMREFFLKQDDWEEAAKFRPSSMEFAAQFGGNPLQMVTEIPLFLIHGESSLEDPIFLRFREELAQIDAASTENGADYAALIERYAIEPLPVALHMKLQLATIVLALHYV